MAPSSQKGNNYRPMFAVEKRWVLMLSKNLTCQATLAQWDFLKLIQTLVDTSRPTKRSFFVWRKKISRSTETLTQSLPSNWMCSSSSAKVALKTVVSQMQRSMNSSETSLWSCTTIKYASTRSATVENLSKLKLKSYGSQSTLKWILSYRSKSLPLDFCSKTR